MIYLENIQEEQEIWIPRNEIIISEKKEKDEE